MTDAWPELKKAGLRTINTKLFNKNYRLYYRSTYRVVTRYGGGFHIEEKCIYDQRVYWMEHCSVFSDVAAAKQEIKELKAKDSFQKDFRKKVIWTSK